jgi:hypothetical protein
MLQAVEAFIEDPEFAYDFAKYKFTNEDWDLLSCYHEILEVSMILLYHIFSFTNKNTDSTCISRASVW